MKSQNWDGIFGTTQAMKKELNKGVSNWLNIKHAGGNPKLYAQILKICKGRDHLLYLVINGRDNINILELDSEAVN
jgi:hypothetical protein